MMTKETTQEISARSQELKKHVAIIHSNNKISLLQRKIANALLFQAYDSLLTKDEHEIHISALAKLIDYDSHDHQKIKQALKDLMATVVEWNIVDGEKVDKENVWNASSIISDASIEGSLCTYSYSGKMRKLLYHPSIYGRLNMRVQAKFQSSYGLALYENCNRYQDIGQTPWFELGKFRKLMGVEDSKYLVFRDFKTRVIDKSVEEVNKHAPLLVEPKLRKQNRRVVAIQFTIKNRIKNDSLQDIANIELLPTVLKLNFGLSQMQIKDVMKNYSEEYTKEKIKIIESSSSYQSGKIKNLGKYLLCALSDDYQLAKQPKIDKKQVVSKEVEQRERQYSKYINTRIFLLFSKLGQPNKEALLRKFEAHIVNSIHKKSYEKKGLDNVLIQDIFVKFVMSTNNELRNEIPSLENWSILQLNDLVQH